MQKVLTRLAAYLSRFAPPLIMMGIIFWWSSRSDIPGAGAQLVWWDFVIKKMAHLIEYALLFFCWQRTINWYTPVDQRTYRLTFLLVILYAFSDEIHQSFTPGRHPQLRDVGVDTLAGFLVYLKMMRFV